MRKTIKRHRVSPHYTHFAYQSLKVAYQFLNLKIQLKKYKVMIVLQFLKAFLVLIESPPSMTDPLQFCESLVKWTRNTESLYYKKASEQRKNI